MNAVLLLLWYLLCLSIRPSDSAKTRTECALLDPAEQKDLILSQAQLNQSQALLGVDHPWENFLVAAPAAIALLGQLTILGGQKDFRLDDRPPAGGFKYLRNPQSFRATMAQVSNDGWNCFSVAHRNMDTIQLNMLMIPRRVQTVVKIMRRASLSLFRRMAQTSLNEIKTIGQQCVTLSTATENEFKKIYNVLGEIVEATQNTRGVYDERQQQTINELKVSLAQKAILEERQESYRKNQEDINKKVQEYEQRYRSALDSIPRGWKKVRMQIAAALGKAFASVINVAGPAMMGGVTSSLRSTGKSRSKRETMDTSIHELWTRAAPKSDVEKALQSSVLAQYGKLFTKTLEEFLVGLTSKSAKVTRDVKSSLTAIGAMLPQLKGDPGYRVFKRALDRAETVVRRTINSTDEDLESSKPAIVEEIEDIKSQSTASTDTETPNGPVVPNGDGQVTGDDEVAQANSAAQWMKYHQERADKNFADLMKNHEMLGTLLARMTQLDLNRIEFEEVLNIIRQSLVILDQIQTQWSMLTQFFMALAVRTETAVNRMINPFVQTIEDLPQSLASEADREITMEVLQTFIPDIQMAAHFLHSLSKTYVQVSSKYILNQLAGMTGLSVLPMEQRQPKMNELADKSKVAEQEIFQMVKEKRLAYGNQVALLAEGCA